MYNLVISHRTLPHNQWETNMLQGIMIHWVNRPQLIVIGIPACLITIGIPACLLTNGIVGGIRSCLITNCIRARAGLLWMGIRKPPNLLVQPVRVINISVKESSYGLLVPRVNKKNNLKVISRVPILRTHCTEKGQRVEGKWCIHFNLHRDYNY